MASPKSAMSRTVHLLQLQLQLQLQHQHQHQHQHRRQHRHQHRLLPPGSAKLVWDSPATRADGSPVGAISGYRIYYGTARGAYSGSTFIAGGTKTTGSVTGLGKGTWYFTVATIDASGNESGFGYEMSKSQ